MPLKLIWAPSWPWHTQFSKFGAWKTRVVINLVRDEMADVKLLQITPMLELLFSFWMHLITQKPSFKGHILKHLINLWSKSKSIIKPLMKVGENRSRIEVEDREQREDVCVKSGQKFWSFKLSFRSWYHLDLVIANLNRTKDQP